MQLRGVELTQLSIGYDLRFWLPANIPRQAKSYLVTLDNEQPKLRSVLHGNITKHKCWAVFPPTRWLRALTFSVWLFDESNLSLHANLVWSEEQIPRVNLLYDTEEFWR